MGTLMFIVVGSIVGFASSRISSWQRKNNVGWSIVVGILGALGGALLGRALGYSTLEAPTFVASVLGAVATVATYLGITTRRTA